MTGKETLDTVIDLYNPDALPEQMLELLNLALKDELISPAERHKAGQYLASLQALKT